MNRGAFRLLVTGLVAAGAIQAQLVEEFRPPKANCWLASTAQTRAAIADAATGRMVLYYGAADSYTALAFCYVDELLAYRKENSEVF